MLAVSASSRITGVVVVSADVFKQATPMKRRQLSDEHRRVLVDGSGILPGLVSSRGYYSLKSVAIKMLVGEQVIADFALQAEAWMGIPIYRPDGSYYGDIIRLFEGPEGKPKYIWPKGQSQVIDIHPDMRGRLSSPDRPIIFTEGIKKGDAILSRALAEGVDIIPISLNGCWGWTAQTTQGSMASPDFRDLSMTKRLVYVNSDSDFRTNNDVRAGWSQAALYFSTKTEEKTKTLLVITPPNGVDKQGADDYFRAGGSLTDLLSYAMTPQLALLDRQTSDEDLPRPVAFRTGIEVFHSAPEQVPYLMEPLLSVGSINLLAGHSGTYKTWHCLSLMLDGAFGYSWTDHPGTKVPMEPFTSIYLNKEMAGAMLDVRLKQLAKAARYTDHPDFARILAERIIIVEEAEIDLANPIQRERIEELISDTGAEMIFLDSFSMCWTGDENSASEVAQFFMQMREITERTSVTWGLVHHLVKPQGSSKNASPASKFAVRGSGQIIQQADAALLFAPLDREKPNDPPSISITHVKTRTTAEMPTWVSTFTDNDGLFSALTYKGALAERRASEYLSSHGDPAKFAAWVRSALESMPVMSHGASGLRTKNLLALLQASWPDKKAKAPSESTIRRQLDNMVMNGDIEVLETNKRVGDLYRLANIPIIGSEFEEE